MSSDVQAAPFAAPEPARFGFLDLLYGVLFRPRATFAEAPLSGSVGAAAGVIVLVALMAAFVFGGGSTASLVLAFVTALAWLMVTWLLLSTALFLVTRALHQAGAFSALMAGTGLSYAPWLLLGPLAGVSGLGRVGALVAGIGTLGVFAWWLRLTVLSLRGSAGLTTGQGVLALAAAELVIGFLPLAWISLWVLTVALLISQAS